MKVNKQNEATPGIATPRKPAAEAAVAALIFPSAMPVSAYEGNCSITENFPDDDLIQTGYENFTQSWNLRKNVAAYRFGTKNRRRQQQLSKSMGGIANRRAENFTPPLANFGHSSRNQQFLPGRGGEGSAWNFNPAIHFTQVVETAPCSAVIEERNRMAREIHDTLAQEFAGILLHLEAVNSSDSSENASEYLARARELAKSGLEDARRMLLGLRPKSLEEADLSHALNQLTGRFSRDCGINCTFSVSGRSHKLPGDIENELYRVAQEALCNVRKHSRAGCASILLSYASEGVVLAIKDNGQGFTMKQPESGAHGFGLPTMCERASRLGGKMDINSGQGSGTEIRMSVPLPGKTSKQRSNQ